MSHRPWKVLLVLGLVTALAACSSNRVLVKKSDLEAADQCLLAQQQRDTTIERQQQQLMETLELLKQTIKLRQQGDSALRDFMQTARKGLDEDKTQADCPSVALNRNAMPSPGSVTDKKIVGAKEHVLLSDLGIVLQSRVDTGATTSSMDARDIEIFERDGDEWVRFKIHDPDLDQLVELERPRSRKVRIVQANSEETEQRPVVEMRITMGSLTQIAEFTLSDRSHMEYPLLIGRNILRDLMLVDVARENMTDPKRPESEQEKNADE